ncbi:MAG: hypothetical protein QXF12_03495 [Candidatus Aenigmatarchaeota archaeon]
MINIVGTIFNLFRNKTLLFIILGSIIFAIIFGYWYYQKSVIENLNQIILKSRTEIENLKLEKSVLEQNVKTLKEANENLVKEINRREEEYKKTIESLKRVNKILENSKKRLEIIERKIRESRERKLKTKNINEIIKKENEMLNCFIKNFNNVQKSCVE